MWRNESLLNLNTYARMVEQDVLAYIMDSNPEAKTGCILSNTKTASLSAKG